MTNTFIEWVNNADTDDFGMVCMGQFEYEIRDLCRQIADTERRLAIAVDEFNTMRKRYKELGRHHNEHCTCLAIY